MEKLASTYFLRDLTRSETDVIRAITRIVEAKQGYLILRQGQPSENLYIVRTGSVRVVLPAPGDEEISDNPEQTLVVLGPGECFGEFAFVDRKPSSATVVANVDCTLYAIGHDQMDGRLSANPTMAAKIYKALLHILVGRFRNTDVQLAFRKALGG